ncbi:MAG: SPOR domain-containing protein [Acidobacteriota bacterium]|nr:SPOR domain-containing protein [Acidobacteriota bacterium]
MIKPQSSIDVELDTLRLLALAALALAALAGAFWLGRWTAPRPARVESAGVTHAETGAAGAEALAGETLFDAAGEGGAVREPGRQVTAEPSRRGRWEVQVGRSAGRRGAEALQRACRQAGVPALLVRHPDGTYGVIGGPYQSQREARRAADRLGRVLGRKVSVARSAE